MASHPELAERIIEKGVLVRAHVDDVWKAWTTPEGAKRFFAPRAEIELKIGGKYEIYFHPEAPKGLQGSEKCKVLSYLPKEMLCFTWNAPPEFPHVRRERRTWVVLQFSTFPGRLTKVRLTHLGWKEGEEWERVFEYFKHEWDVVLGRLQYSYAENPIDWSNPYRPPGT